ncbi:MAG: acyltransferase family protein [Asticcacaulis sp.]
MTKTKDYRSDIDGLRAIAIISVVAFHAGIPFFNGGFVGVDIFFVISGYLICSHIINEVSSGNFTFSSFYERRAKRILPALIAVITFVYIASYFILSTKEMKKFEASAICALVGFSNNFFLLKTNYFETKSSVNPLLMTWSLGVEEQFYIVFPLIVIFIKKYARQFLDVSILAIVIISFVSAVILNLQNPSAAFYLFPVRAWEIGAGCLIVLYERSYKERFPLNSLAIECLGGGGIALITCSILLFSSRTAISGFPALLPVAGSAFLIAGRASWVNRNILSFRPFVAIGLVSYSWYLWHWPLLSLMDISVDHPPSVWVRLAIISLALVIGYFSYRFIETPFRRMQASRKTILVGYSIAVAVCMAPAALGLVSNGLAWRLPDSVIKADDLTMEATTNPCLALEGETGPRMAAGCVSKGSGPTVAIIGDSHAAALSLAIEQDSRQPYGNITIMTKAACPPLHGYTTYDPLNPNHSSECAVYNDKVLNYILNHPEITKVVLAGYWVRPVSGEFSGMGYIPNGANGLTQASSRGAEIVRKGLADEIGKLASSGRKIYVVQDVPIYHFDPMHRYLSNYLPVRDLVARIGGKDSGSGDKGVSNDYDSGDARQQIESLGQIGNVRVIDPARVLCQQNMCRFSDDSGLLYRDSQHLNRLGAARVWTYIESQF